MVAWLLNRWFVMKGVWLLSSEERKEKEKSVLSRPRL